MSESLIRSGHSAHVEMQLLLISGVKLSIGQMGPDFLLLDDPIDHAPTEATIAFSVDGDERRWKVQLPEDISDGQERVRLAKA